jgi:hypothetical protein
MHILHLYDHTDNALRRGGIAREYCEEYSYIRSECDRNILGLVVFLAMTGNLLEDVAGFGLGRKIYQASHLANDTTFRRAWGMFNYHGTDSVKQTFTMAYESTGNTCENCIGTYDRGTEIGPGGSSIASPAPIAAASGSSIRWTDRAPAASHASTRARSSTSVMPDGAHIMTRGWA